MKESKFSVNLDSFLLAKKFSVCLLYSFHFIYITYRAFQHWYFFPQKQTQKLCLHLQFAGRLVPPHKENILLKSSVFLKGKFPLPISAGKCSFATLNNSSYNAQYACCKWNSQVLTPCLLSLCIWLANTDHITRKVHTSLFVLWATWFQTYILFILNFFEPGTVERRYPQFETVDNVRSYWSWHLHGIIWCQNEIFKIISSLHMYICRNPKPYACTDASGSCSYVLAKKRLMSDQWGVR